MNDRYNVQFQFQDYSGMWRNVESRESVVENTLRMLLEQVKSRYPEHRVRALDQKTNILLDIIF
jgi:hypothetical protein